MEGRNNLGRRDNGWQHDRHHGGDGGRDDRPYHSRNREIDRDRGHYGAPSSRHRDDRPPRDFSRRDRSRSREREPRGHGDNHRGSYRGESRDSDRGYGGRRGDSNRDDQGTPFK